MDVQRITNVALTPRGDHGALGLALMVLRVVPGLVFIVAGIGKFVTFQSEVDAFESFGIPWPEVMVVLSGLVESVCGVFLVLGLLTRPVAFLLAVNMGIAIGTAGRTVGGPFHLGVAPALLVLMLIALWSGGTQWSVDRRLLARRGGPISRG